MSSNHTKSLLILPVLAVVVCAAGFAYWITARPAGDEKMRVPIERDIDRGATGEVANPGTLTTGSGSPSDFPGSWPQFRGENRDNIAVTTRTLARTWPDEGPRELWRITVGEGHAGAAIHNGRVYFTDYDRDKEEDSIRCLSLDTGEDIWRYGYSVVVKRNHGMSRTVPAVNDKYVVSLGPKCHVHCQDAITGEAIWETNLVEEHDTEVPLWYAGQCPLIDGDKTILAPGGDPLMMAVDLSSGTIVWETPEKYDGYGMTHSSIVPMEFNGRRQYLYCSVKGVVSVSAEDGSVLWEYPDWKIKIANIPSPVIVGDDRVFFTGGYDAGCLMLQLTVEGDKIVPKEVFRLDSDMFGSDQQTPILYQDHIYGVKAKPESEMTCLDLEGNVVWTSGADARFGLGPYMIANGQLLILNDQEGTLHMAPATPSGYRELTSAKILNGHDAWAPLAIAEGRVILRDLTEMVCIDIGKPE